MSTTRRRPTSASSIRSSPSATPSAVPSVCSRTTRAGGAATSRRCTSASNARSTGRTNRPSAAARYALLVEPFAQQADAVAAPEQLAGEHEGRHAEDARSLRLAAQPVVLGAALAGDEAGEARRRAGLDQKLVHFVDALRVDRAAPETVKGEVIVSAKH